MKLVIVESPAKCKTIEKYLGKDYKVVSSKGHIRDLSTKGKYGFGIDIENDFKPTYEIIKGKSKDVNALKKSVKEADKIYLATDPDREGEIISWHLFDELKIDEEKYERIVFNEITEKAIANAINNPNKLNMNLIKSGETRRFLDRIIGFRLSKLMQNKTGGKSAGRVQSVALKIIVDREREIENFIPEEYWTIEANFNTFKATLDKYLGKDIKINNEVEANKILNELVKTFNIDSISEKDKKRAAREVFKTSTLQQLAASKLGFSPSKTMRIAQKLYEGIDLDNETVGLITYMRTDSVRISDSFIKETFCFIKGKYGEKYIGYVKAPKKAGNIQDAHEGIRPTSINRQPKDIKKYLSTDEFKLYNLIYKRSLASLMSDALLKSTTIILENNKYTFKATGSVLIFDGYLKEYSEFEDQEDVNLPDFKNYQSKVLTADEIIKEQHFTKPLPRFNESSLIKELESLGIGRPSTYSTIIETIKSRGYVDLVDKKFIPTKIGFENTDKLQEFFSEIVNVKYTAKMEEDLDKIALAEEKYLKILQNFYQEFEPLVQKAFAEMEKKGPQETGEICPECKNKLVIRNGRFGEFTGCSNYPECRYIKKEIKEDTIVMPCPKCDGIIIEKRTKRGKTFWGCKNYPKCDYASWYKPTEEKCEVCNNNIVEKNKKKFCPNCKI